MNEPVSLKALREEPRFKAGLLEASETVVRGEKLAVYQDFGCSILSQYLKRGTIDDRQFEGGVLFAQDYRHVEGRSSGVSSYGERMPANSNFPEFVAISVERWRCAAASLNERGCSLAMWVACHDGSAHAWAHHKGVDRKYAIERLREVLDDLARFYGVP